LLCGTTYLGYKRPNEIDVHLLLGGVAGKHLVEPEQIPARCNLVSIYHEGRSILHRLVLAETKLMSY
jgi:hypothetical protein